MKDLTPKYTIPSAEVELALQPGVNPMGYSVGGVSAFNNAFKRGYGNNVWGVDERGQWMGAADFDNAPYRVSMSGSIRISSEDVDSASLLTPEVLVFYNDAVPEIILGDPDAEGI